MKLYFDFRTKLIIIVLTMSLVSFLTSDILIYMLICALSIYLFLQGYVKVTLIYDIICLFFALLRVFSNGNGITFLMPEMFLFMVLRMMLMAMASYPIIGMAPGEAVATFKKLHAPESLALPMTFMLRFFPTVKGEFNHVFSSLKLRKLLSWRHPLNSLEYIVTPIIFRSSRISEELAASAECRGISYPGNHTCLRKIEFKFQDGIMTIVAILITVLLYFLEKGWFNYGVL